MAFSDALVVVEFISSVVVEPYVDFAFQSELTNGIGKRHLTGHMVTSIENVLAGDDFHIGGHFVG
jgi:hypothetical protein